MPNMFQCKKCRRKIWHPEEEYCAKHAYLASEAGGSGGGTPTHNGDNNLQEILEEILEDKSFIHYSCGINADPADGFGDCTCHVKDELKETAQSITEVITEREKQARAANKYYMGALEVIKAEHGGISLSLLNNNKSGKWFTIGQDYMITELSAKRKDGEEYE